MKPADNPIADNPPGNPPKRLASWYAPGLSDGIGDRLLMFDNTSAPSLELLRFRPELAASPGFEIALRERVDRLRRFSHPSFAQVRAVERLSANDDLALVSNHTQGKRLSEVLAEARGPAFAVELIRQLTPALATLHQQGERIAHGALGADRIVVTPEGRLVIVEHVLGSALERLRLPATRLRADLGIVVPPTADPAVPGLDHHTDILQLGLVALSLLAGRRIRPDEYPQGVEGLLNELATQPSRTSAAAFPEMQQWLEHALQVNGRVFDSARHAQDALNGLPRDGKSKKSTATVAALVPFPIVSDRVPDESTSSSQDPSVPVRSPRHAPAPVVDQSAPAPLSTPQQPSATVGTPQQQPALASTAQQPSAPVSTREHLSIPVSPPPGDPLADFADEAADHVPPAAPPPHARHAEERPVAIATAFPTELRMAAAPDRAARKPAAPVAKPIAPAATAAGNSALGKTLHIDAPVRPTPSVVAESRPVEAREKVGPAARAARGRMLTAAVAVLAVGEAFVIAALLYAPATPAAVTIETGQPGTTVLVDGEPIGVTPLQLQVGTDTRLIRLENPEPRSPEVRKPPPSAPRARANPAVRQAGAAPAAATPAAQSRPSGIRVVSPIELQVFEGGRLLGSTADASIAAPPGRHEFDLVNKALGYRLRQVVNIPAEQIVQVGITPPDGRLSINALPWAEVWIDGKLAGETPLGNLTVPIGEHEILFRHPQLGEQRQTAIVKSDGVTRVTANLQR